MKRLFLLLVSVCLLWAGPAFATNITIYDENSYSTTGWYAQHKAWYGRHKAWYGPQEDQEVEPGMARSQAWDLEGFFTNGTSLSLVGGYDFKKGVEGYTSGDIFIDTDPLSVDNPVYGGHGPLHGDDGNMEVPNTYGYDYVLDLNWDGLTYNVYKIDQNTQVRTAYYHQNQGSSPWQFNVSDNSSEGALDNGVVSISSGIIGYTTGLTDNDTGFSGGTHNKLVVDLGFLNQESGQDYTDFTVHYTMRCGNDNIMGRGTIPNPEPATLLLFGCGLLGIAGICRKKF